MSDRDERLEGSIEEIVYEAPDTPFKVLKFETDDGERVTVVGELPAVASGQTLQLSGEWDRHPKYGRQFRAEEWELTRPTDPEGIKRYLASRLIKGIGPELAERIVDRFGSRTLEVMDQDIEKLEEVSGIGSATLKRVREQWEDQKRRRGTLVDLKSHDIGTGYALKIHEEYGDEASAILRTNPYRLCRDVRGIGFKTADRIARKMGVNADDPERIQAGLKHTLRDALDEGHLFLPREELLRRAVDKLETDRDRVEEELGTLRSDDRVVVESNEETSAVYLRTWFERERRVADRLLELREVRPSVESPENDGLRQRLSEEGAPEDVTYNARQIEAIERAIDCTVLLLTGGPGTGKTTTVQGMLRLMDAWSWDVRLTAPTGRAAQRLSEATDHPASTVHRLLGYQPPNHFRRHRDRPLNTDAVIVDEMSMMDLWLMAHLLEAVEEGTRLILVGDADQLPSVGPGNVFNDLLDSDCFETVRLREIFRQARESRIVVNAHRVNQGEMPILENRPDEDFFMLKEETPEGARDTVRDVVTERLPRHLGLDPFEDIQVLAPMYRGICGVDNLNVTLQDRLNPDGSREGEDVFRVGDRVMQLTNNYENGVFNGDVGRVRTLEPEEGRLEVTFPEAGRVSYQGPERRQLTLAYAATIHKSQGSEYPAVVICLLTQHYVMLQRNLLYTALTRARDLAVLVGSGRAVAMAVENDEPRSRYTQLARRLQNALRV